MGLPATGIHILLSWDCQISVKTQRNPIQSGMTSMFPESFAETWIDRTTRRGDVVLDPVADAGGPYETREGGGVATAPEPRPGVAGCRDRRDCLPSVTFATSSAPPGV